MPFAIENLPDAELERLNQLLPWRCFVLDQRGRQFGKAASASKRNEPQPIPDPRIAMLNERMPLAEQTVLELGCFEGVHTVGLARFAKSVKACDSRIENVVKTVVRCALHGVFPETFFWDVEQAPPAGVDLSCDVLHHVGVLYHLIDPVSHLHRLAPLVRRGVMLDTHYALPQEAKASYQAGSRTYPCKLYREGGREDAFSGMYESARWLLLDDLVALLQTLGFGAVEIVEKREERNGPRVLLLAERKA